MNNILIVCPTLRDKRELEQFNSKKSYEFFYYDYACNEIKSYLAEGCIQSCEILDLESKLEEAIRFYSDLNINAIISTDDYPGSILVQILSYELCFTNVHPKMALLSQQKYFSRLIQKKVLPEAVPNFFLINLIDKNYNFPFFLKPVKSIISVGSCIINSFEDLKKIKKIRNYESFLYPFKFFLKKYADCQIGTYYMGEQILRGYQVTLDGYVFHNEIYILGIVDSVMFEGTFSFKRFEYPSRLPKSIQDRMSMMASELIKKFGFANTLFNVEFMYDEEDDKIYIIELHPRMSSQFADLYEKVDGINSYQILLDIASGKIPQIKKNIGEHKIAASCVFRTFQNQFVIEVPSKQEIDFLSSIWPDIRIEIYAEPGKKLSEQRQDFYSYRYGIINIGGRDLQEILEIFEYCKNNLTFKFKPV